jgi:RNA polymerase sigma factor (sigma-70 family)
MNRLRDRYRRGRHERPADLSAVPGPAPPPAQAAEEAELAEELRQALTHLPQQQAEVFCLYALDGWSYRDVAEQLTGCATTLRLATSASARITR